MITMPLVLAVRMLLGAVPAWPHSRNRGNGPSGGLGLLILLILIVTGPLLAQETPGSQSLLSAHGELRRVNQDAKTFVIKIREGSELLLRFTSETTTGGATSDAPAGGEGLATMLGKHVMVEYQMENRIAVATMVATQSRPSAPANLRVVTR